VNGLIVLVVLFVEVVFRVEVLPRDFAWLGRWNEWLHRRFGSGRDEGTYALVALGGAVLAALLLAGLLRRMPGVFELPLSLAVVYLACGPANPLLALDRYCEAFAARDEDGAETAAQDLRVNGDSARLEPERVARWFARQAHDTLFAVLVLTFVLGPFGAMLARIALVDRDPSFMPDDRTRRYAGVLFDVLMYVPARVYALFAALAGSFAHVFEVWQAREDYSLAATHTLAPESTLAAARYGSLEDGIVGDAELVWLRAVRALVTRVCAILGGIAVLSMVV